MILLTNLSRNRKTALESIKDNFIESVLRMIEGLLKSFKFCSPATETRSLRSRSSLHWQLLATLLTLRKVFHTFVQQRSSKVSSKYPHGFPTPQSSSRQRSLSSSFPTIQTYMPSSSTKFLSEDFFSQLQRAWKQLEAWLKRGPSDEVVESTMNQLEILSTKAPTFEATRTYEAAFNLLVDLLSRSKYRSKSLDVLYNFSLRRDCQKALTKHFGSLLRLGKQLAEAAKIEEGTSDALILLSNLVLSPENHRRLAAEEDYVELMLKAQEIADMPGFIDDKKVALHSKLSLVLLSPSGLECDEADKFSFVLKAIKLDEDDSCHIKCKALNALAAFAADDEKRSLIFQKGIAKFVVGVFKRATRQCVLAEAASFFAALTTAPAGMTLWLKFDSGNPACDASCNQVLSVYGTPGNTSKDRLQLGRPAAIFKPNDLLELPGNGLTFPDRELSLSLWVFTPIPVAGVLYLIKPKIQQKDNATTLSSNSTVVTEALPLNLTLGISAPSTIRKEVSSNPILASAFSNLAGIT
eukprot:TRINITY_DN2994_c0_g1_i3.p1 TRINITY_DN2994_c0_g1~~TRINITY_DN2994_c0_g1_i3.p1  ORF type:complete len:524 (+),score=77.60 TRINITY_DN2994_c0_g1_i3:698-2269(+)